MKIPDKVYDVLKYVCTIALPAIAAFLGIVLPAVGVADGTVTLILTIITATATLIGALIGVSSVQYKKEQEAYAKITCFGYDDTVEIPEDIQSIYTDESK